MTWTTRDGLSSDVVLSLAGDSSGTIWIGTEGGLLRFERGRFTLKVSDDGGGRLSTETATT